MLSMVVEEPFKMLRSEPSTSGSGKELANFSVGNVETVLYCDLGLHETCTGGK
jgi:hypothetical protein